MYMGLENGLGLNEAILVHPMTNTLSNGVYYKIATHVLIKFAFLAPSEVI